MQTQELRTIFKALTTTSYRAKSKFSTMSKMQGTLSMLVTANGRSKLYLKNYIRKAKWTCSRTTTIHTTIEVKGTTTSQVLANLLLVVSNVWCGEDLEPTEIQEIHNNKSKVVSQNQEPWADKLMHILKSRCIGIETSEITFRSKRKKTWISCSTTSMDRASVQPIIQPRISTRADQTWRKRAKKACPLKEWTIGWTVIAYQRVKGGTGVQIRIWGEEICKRKICRQHSVTEKCTK